MDYTQTSQPSNPDNRQAFFTAGAGADFENEKSIEPENNLDLTNSAWGEGPERDPRSVGSNVLSSNIENPADFKEYIPKDQRLDQIIRVEMPPGVELEAEETVPQPDSQDISLSKRDFITGDKITTGGLNLINSEENKLAQDGDIASFYDFVSEAREAVRSDKGAK